MRYLIIVILLFVLEAVYLKIAAGSGRLNFYSQSGSKVSRTVTGGGFIFLVAMWLVCAFFGTDYPWFMAGVTLVGIVSYIDDLHPLPVNIRLVIQFGAIALLGWQLYPDFSWPLISLAAVVCVGILNAYNFMDGINGITGAYSLAVLLPLIYLNRIIGFISMPYLYAAGLSLLVFGFYNFRKQALCFAGDVGSVSMGFIVLFPLAKLILATGDIVYILFLAVYGADTLLTIFRRIQMHENLWRSHHHHVYQNLVYKLNYNPLLVSSIYASLQLLISFGLIFIPVNNWIYAAVIIAALILGYFLYTEKSE